MSLHVEQGEKKRLGFHELEIKANRVCMLISEAEARRGNVLSSFSEGSSVS